MNQARLKRTGGSVFGGFPRTNRSTYGCVRPGCGWQILRAGRDQKRSQSAGFYKTPERIHWELVRSHLEIGPESPS